MECGLWVAVGLLALMVAVLLIENHLLRKSADEIRCAFADRLATETNTLIDVSGHDKHMMKLAAEINAQLVVLRTQRQRFVQGDAELKEAVTNIAHDLRTPLTAISGYLQLLESEPCGETVRRYLNLISNRAEAMKRLTDELFRYSVLTTQPEMTPETVSINAVLEESLAAAYANLTQRGITPEIIIPHEKVERFLDRSALSRVFENVLANAAKYSDGDLRVELAPDGNIEFANTASGLDAVSVGRLFDRFYTVETGRHSTGLGLAIAKMLTERMGGSIMAEYQENTLHIRMTFDMQAGA